MLIALIIGFTYNIQYIQYIDSNLPNRKTHLQYNRVRALFSDFADDSLHNPSKHTPSFSANWPDSECCPQLSEMARTERDDPM